MLITGNITSIYTIYFMSDIELDGYIFPFSFDSNVTNLVEIGDNITITLNIIKGDQYSLFSYEEGIGFDGETELGGTLPSSIIKKNDA